MNEKLEKFFADEERKEQMEHRDVLLAIAVLLKQKEGIQLFSYLFKNFEVTSLPDKSLKGDELHEYLGFLRAGNSIYKLASEADSEISASILAKMERTNYERIVEQYRIENGIK